MFVAIENNIIMMKDNFPSIKGMKSGSVALIVSKMEKNTFRVQNDSLCSNIIVIQKQ